MKKLLFCRYDEDPNPVAENENIAEIYDDEDVLQLRINELCLWSNINFIEFGPSAYGVIKELKIYEITSEQDVIFNSETYCELARKNLEEEAIAKNQKKREENLKEYYRLKKLLQIE
jgi:hypothetical protein